ncbi:hypothetical protein [Bacillus horti]|uniref:DNA-binding transcriptional ArsR family regulator n=1 Tax=Caldalkalibacillus horti TaxID=77523 RepID=A0ABT9VYM6_9BACI|nr:DNA-binding transcriptional ArsR family regulator [Bacillus horti]
MNNYNSLTNLIKTLQDPIRLKIIEILESQFERREYLPVTREGSNGFCPMDILKILKEDGFTITNTKLSYHLKELKENNIVSLAREGKRYFYVLNKEGFQVLLSWLNSIHVYL